MANPHHSPPDAIEREPATRSDAAQERAAADGRGPGYDGGFYGGEAPRGKQGFYAGGDEDWSARYGAWPPPRASPDLSALLVLLDALRQAAPAELQERLTGLVREALLTLRSLIDWYLERLDRPPRETRVEDIPID